MNVSTTVKRRVAGGIAACGGLVIVGSMVILLTGWAPSISAAFASPRSAIGDEAVVHAEKSIGDSAAEADAPAPTPVTTSVPTSVPTDSPMTVVDVAPIEMSAEERANRVIWVAQQDLIVTCMANAGFTYVYVPYGGRADCHLPSSQSDSFPEWKTMTVDQQNAAFDALWGPRPGPAVYSWNTAGCIGYAVHETGMDGQN
jgi:hypothetical protein